MTESTWLESPEAEKVMNDNEPTQSQIERQYVKAGLGHIIDGDTIPPDPPAKSPIEEKYEQRQARIRAQLASIETMIDNHDKMNPRKNWGHTGDLGMVIGRLNEVTEFLRRYR